MTSSSSTETGSTLLFLSGLIFLCSLAAAAASWYYLHHSSIPTPQPGASLSAVPTDIRPDFLNPHIIIDETLREETDTLHKNLITPLRQYYATQDARLTTIAVTPSDNETYPATVSLTLHPPDQEEQTLIFLYDFSVWNLSMLDNKT